MKVRTRYRLALALLGVLCGSAQAGEVSVAVASNFTDAIQAIVPRFEADTGHSVKVSFGSTGKLYAQIANGAPFEVFLAADTARPARLESEGFTVAGSRYTYASGRLVLWSPDVSVVDSQGIVLELGDFRKLAIANPKTAPYGLAARQVLDNLHLWEALQSKLVRGDNIAQAFQFVATQNAQLGFVAKSQVMALDEADRGSYWNIGTELYSPIEQQAVLLKRGENDEAARAFVEYLKGERARSVIKGFGYGLE